MRRLARCLGFLLLTACGVGISEPIPSMQVQAVGLDMPMLYTQSTTLAPKDTGPATTVNLSALTFQLDPGSAAQNFDFLSSVKVFVVNDKLPQVEVATLSPVPSGSSSLSLTIEPNVNLQGYLSSGCTIDVVLVGTFPTQSVSFSGEIDAWVGM